MDWDKYPMTNAVRNLVNTASALASEMDGYRRVKFEDLDEKTQATIVNFFDPVLPTLAKLTEAR